MFWAKELHQYIVLEMELIKKPVCSVHLPCPTSSFYFKIAELPLLECFSSLEKRKGVAVLKCHFFVERGKV